jgi:hypothetical protein
MFNVVINNNTIEQYDKLLSRFGDWIYYKRDIKLNTILEKGKKIEFKLDIENHQFSSLYVFSTNEVFPIIYMVTDVHLKNVCAVTKSMIFIIDNYNIISLEMELEILDTDSGKILSNIIKDVELELYQKIVDGNVIGFYFKINSKAY